MRDLTGHKITDRKRGATLQVRLRLKFEKPRRIGRARLTLVVRKPSNEKKISNGSGRRNW